MFAHLKHLTFEFGAALHSAHKILAYFGKQFMNEISARGLFPISISIHLLAFVDFFIRQQLANIDSLLSNAAKVEQ